MNQSKSPDLLKPDYSRETFIDKAHFKIVLTSKIIIIAVETLLIGAIVLHSKVDTDIESTLENVYKLEATVRLQKEHELLARDTIKRIAYYKELQKKQKKIGNKVEQILKNTQSNVQLISVDIKSTEFKVRLRTFNPLGVSELISKYLESGITKEITLTYATLEAHTKSFEVGLEAKL